MRGGDTHTRGGVAGGRGGGRVGQHGLGVGGRRGAQRAQHLLGDSAPGLVVDIALAGPANPALRPLWVRGVGKVEAVSDAGRADGPAAAVEPAHEAPDKTREK